MPLFPDRRKDHTWFYRHSLSIVLAALLLAQTAHAVWVGHWVWIHDTQTHGGAAIGWPSEFWIWWSWEYNVSLVADTFGVILIVLLSKWLYEQGSDEVN
jgi:hypothetical protein